MLDFQLEFDPPQTAMLAQTNSSNVIDFLVQRDVGLGWDLNLNFDVQVAFTSAGATTLQIGFQGSPDNVNWYTMLLSPVIPKAQLVPGAQIFRYKLPASQLLEGGPGGQSNINPVGSPLRYARLLYTIATGPFTGGTFVAYITGDEDRPQYYTYPRNYNVAA